MRRKRRVEIHIEHREISIFSSLAPPPAQSLNATTSGSGAILKVGSSTCPTCGSPELVLLTDAVTRASFDVTALNQGMRDGRIHYHRTPSGEWWLCAKSLAKS